MVQWVNGFWPSFILAFVPLACDGWARLGRIFPKREEVVYWEADSSYKYKKGDNKKPSTWGGF
jgi:hypothetical protein